MCIRDRGKAGIGDDAVSVVIPDAVAYLPLEDLVDFEKEKERLLSLIHICQIFLESEYVFRE